MTTIGRMRRGLVATAALVVLTGGCSYERERERVREAEGDPLRIDAELISSLESFDQCDDLLAYLRTEGAKVVGPFGFEGGRDGGFVATAGRAVAGSESEQFSADADSSGGATAAPAPQSAAPAATTTPVAGTDYSATNVQEEGVDEPDLVKTDGRRLVTIGRGELRIVDLTGDAPRLAASLRLGDQGHLDGQLLLHDDRVVVLRPEWPAPMPMPTPLPQPSPMPVEPGGGAASARGSWAPYPQGEPRTNVTVVDLADIAAPRIVEEVVLDGSLVAARMVGGVARVVLRSGPPSLPFLFPSGSQDSVDVATEANRKLVAESTLDDWLPGFTVGDGSEQRLTDCRDVSRPEVFSGVGMLSVVTVDATDPRPGPAATVVGAGEIVYASAEHLYVTSTAWKSTTCPPNADCSAPPSISTDIHAFDIRDRVRTEYLASGRVKGRLLNSFSMSEHEGDLRVATTDDVAQESAVVILRRQDAGLAEVGSVGGLGKTERIYAVRFLGDQGYVVTFRQTDPLYVLDLSDPAAPALRGELKIPGYSAYLHPIGDGRLLGIGQDATDQGRVQGTQLSLFDVSDPADPRRLATATLPQSNSEAEYDHHAFLWWARTNLAVIPVQDYRTGTSGAVGFTVTGDAVEQTGRITQRDVHPIRRSVVVGDRLLTLSDSGVQANDLTTLAERSWLAY